MILLQHTVLTAQCLELSLYLQLRQPQHSISPREVKQVRSEPHMAAANLKEEKSLYEQIKNADPEEVQRRQQAINDRIHATFQKSQQRLAGLIEENSTLPTTVSSVTVLGASNTRHGFLKRIVEPLLSANRDRPYTQSELVQEASKAASKLSKFGRCCPYSRHSPSDQYRYLSPASFGVH